MTAAYLESSALLLALLQGNSTLEKEIAAQETLVASTLTFLEGHRVLMRALHNKEIDANAYTKLKRQLDDIELSCALKEVDAAVLARARQPFLVEPVRSLDAVHLATIDLAKAAGINLVFATDPRVVANADAMGLEVRPAPGRR